MSNICQEYLCSGAKITEVQCTNEQATTFLRRIC